jgi:hypothetical protein
VDVDALDRAAALAGVVEGAVGQALGGGLHVDVSRRRRWVLAAQLELGLDQPTGHALGDLLAGGVAAGEEDAVDGCSSRARPDLAGAHHRDEGVRGMPASTRSWAMRRPVMVACSEGL